MENKAMDENTICNVNKSDFNLKFNRSTEQGTPWKYTEGDKIKIFKITGKAGDKYIYIVLRDGKNPW